MLAWEELHCGGGHFGQSFVPGSSVIVPFADEGEDVVCGGAQGLKNGLLLLGGEGVQEDERTIPHFRQCRLKWEATQLDVLGIWGDKFRVLTVPGDCCASPQGGVLQPQTDPAGECA